MDADGAARDGPAVDPAPPGREIQAGGELVALQEVALERQANFACCAAVLVHILPAGIGGKFPDQLQPAAEGIGQCRKKGVAVGKDPPVAVVEAAFFHGLRRLRLENDLPPAFRVHSVDPDPIRRSG